MRPSSGIAVTIYPCSQAHLEAALPLLIELRPPIVQLHTQPDPPDAPLLRTLRKELPGVRVWMGAGANGLAAGDLSADLKSAREWARWCDANSVELLVFNCEGDNNPKTPDWLIDEPGEDVALADRMGQLLRAAREVAPSLALGFTSHDRVRSWRLPWGAALGPASPVVVNADQVYPAESIDPARWISRRGAVARLDGTNAQLASLVARGTIRPDLGVGGAGRAIYTQLWGLQPAAVASLLDRSDLAAAWALPLYPKGRAQVGGINGLRLGLECRRRYGDSAGAIRRAQQALGLVVDGIPGPATAQALGVPW